MKTITFEALEAEVRRLVAESPDYIYPRSNDFNGTTQCVYNPTATKPACLFGQAFTNLGSPAEAYHEGASAAAVFAEYQDFGSITDLPAGQETWLSYVQTAQDRGDRWEDALRLGDEAMKPYRAMAK